MALTTGLDALSNAIREGKEKNAERDAGGTGYSNDRWLKYISWKDGDRKIIRFLTNALVVGDFYQQIITKEGKTTGFLVDPEKGDFVAEFGAKQKDFLGQTVEPKKKRQAVGLAVLRKEVTRNGKIVIEDDVIPLKIGENTYDARTFGLVQQSFGNFWDQIEYMAKKYGTLTDRDYEITRDGSDKDTKYRILPVDVDPELANEDDLKAFYGYGTEAPADDDPDRFLYCPQTLDTWSEDYTGRERAERLLDNHNAHRGAPTPPASGLDQFKPPAPQGNLHAGDGDPRPEPSGGSSNFESIRSRLKPQK